MGVWLPATGFAVVFKMGVLCTNGYLTFDNISSGNF